MTAAVYSRRHHRSFSYRPDIDGLRAIAVFAVVIFHSFPGHTAPGGFVGVDIFFVISGFLISGIILDEIASGRFSFLNFYGRRARRLFPALALVIATTWLIGWFALLPQEYAALGRAIAAGAAFVSNIATYFDVGYFDPPAQSKPLLHLWSLGVEEQFYLLFPLLTVIGVRFRGTLPMILGILGVASLLLNIATVVSDHSFAFYWPVTRLWEFALGAALAERLENSGRSALFTKPILNELSALSGMALILGSIRFATEVNFPGWQALAPTMGTVLVIGSGRLTIINRLLAFKPTVYAGLVSYPLYLWHWPLIVYARLHFGADDRQAVFAAVVLSCILAVATFELVERPIRQCQRPHQLRVIVASTAALCVVCGLGIATARDGLLIRYPSSVRQFLVPRHYADDFIPWTNDGDRAGPLVVTWGDSHADHILQGLIKLQAKRPFRINWARWWDECPPDGQGTVDWQRCPAPGPKVMRAIEAQHPDVVIVANYWRQYPDAESQLRKTLDFLNSIHIPRVVVLGPVPYWSSFATELIYKSYAASGGRVPARLKGASPEDANVDRRIGEIAKSMGATFISLRQLLCNADGCLVTADDKPIQSDQSHFTVSGSWYVVRHIEGAIFGAPESYK